MVGWPYREFSVKGGFRPSAHYAGMKYFDFVHLKGAGLFSETRLKATDRLQSNLSKVVGNATWQNCVDNI